MVKPLTNCTNCLVEVACSAGCQPPTPRMVCWAPSPRNSEAGPRMGEEQELAELPEVHYHLSNLCRIVGNTNSPVQ